LLQDNIGHPINKLVIEMKERPVKEFAKRRYGKVAQTAHEQKAYQKERSKENESRSLRRLSLFICWYASENKTKTRV